MAFAMGITLPNATIQSIQLVIERMARPTSQNLDRIEKSVRFGFAANFARQAAADSGPWAPLAPRTQRERRFAGFNPSSPILVRTGAYMRSWTVSGKREMEYRPNGWTMLVSSGDYREAVHELGDRGRNVPARPVRYLDSAGERNIAAAVNDMADRVARTVL